MKPHAARSVFINTTDPAGYSWTVCRRLAEGSGWVNGHMTLVNGRWAQLTTFSSIDCSEGLLKKRDFTVPRRDGLKNFWANMM